MSQFPPNFHRSSRYWRAGPVESENTCGNIPVCLCLTLQRFPSTFSSRSAVSVLSSAGLENKNMWRVFFCPKKRKKKLMKAGSPVLKKKKKVCRYALFRCRFVFASNTLGFERFSGWPQKPGHPHGLSGNWAWKVLAVYFAFVCVFCSLLLIHVCTRQSFIAHTSVAVVGICFSIFGWNGCGRVGGSMFRTWNWICIFYSSMMFFNRAGPVYDTLPGVVNCFFAVQN